MKHIWDIILIVLGGGGIVGIYFSLYQLIILKRTHLFNVYNSVIQMIDEPELREARHYVYSMNPTTYNNECWLDIDQAPAEKRSDYLKNKQQAEKILRVFGNLSVMVRNKKVPIELIIEYYIYPIIICWDKLFLYIDAIRRSGRNNIEQPGHMWVFEYLVFEIVVKGLRKNKGKWKGAMERDGINLDFLDRLENDHQNMLKISKLPKAI